MRTNTSIRHGFTIVEFLVVFAIIGLIAALVFAGLSAARASARRASCLSNERQLGAAILLYIQDYDERFPSGTQRIIAEPGAPETNGEGWGGQVFPYAKTKATFHCPDDTTEPSGYIPALSYAYNSWLTASRAVNSSTAQVPYTTSTVLLFEVADSHADVQAYDEGASQGASTFSASGYAGVLYSGPGGSGQRSGPKFATGQMVGQAGQASIILDPRHRGGSNFCLVDGHVKWLRPKQVASGENRMPDQQWEQLAAHFLDQNYKRSP